MDVPTVSEINTYIYECITNDEILGDLWVCGEITNFKRAASGHCYFSLRDTKAVLKAVMWRSYAVSLSDMPENGDAVLAHGAISFYQAGGDIQFYVDTLQPAGVGILQAKFEQLRIRLQEEGLFDTNRKRHLPLLPRRVGIATSAQGAALQDILTILERRCPLLEVLISPCQVQGEQAPDSIVAALQLLYHSDVDVIILARGGGSVEDLWCFNDEAVARAVFASPVPIITGVGHETDTTIVDYVADHRAPTPSAAAELVAPELEALSGVIGDLRLRLEQAIDQIIADRQQQLLSAINSLERYTPADLLERSRQQTEDLQRRMATQVRYYGELQKMRLESLRLRLEALNPRATLERGYALVRRGDNGMVVSRATQTRRGDMLTITMHDGTFAVERT